MMKKLLLAFAMSAALAGCATNGDNSCSSDPICVAKQGVTAGYQLHTFLDNEAVSLHNSGTLTGTSYDTVRNDLNVAKKGLDTAYSATTAADINFAVGQADNALSSAEKDGNLKAPGAK